MEGCNGTILQPFIVSACRCLWLLFDIECCKSAWSHMSFIQMYRRHTHTHTHTHTMDLISMPHAVGFCMDINIGKAPLHERQSCLVFRILVQFVWRELKPGWDTRFIIAEAELTNISHCYIVLTNGARLYSGSAGWRDILASVTWSVIISFMTKRVNLSVFLWIVPPPLCVI